MLVSVIMLTYNHEKFISKSIEGVLCQETNFPFELIIANDNSTDKTKDIIRSYEIRYKEIIRGYDNLYNIGPKKNFIKAYDISCGKYVAMCEGDDYWNDPYKLQKQVDFLESNADFVICFHDIEIIDESGNKVERDRLFEKEKKDYNINELLFGKYIPTPTLMFRKHNLIGYYKSFKKVFNGDTLLLSILTQNGRTKYLNYISPSVIIKHKDGIWSGKHKLQKWQNNLNTYLNIFKIIDSKLKEEYFKFLKKSFGSAIHESIKEGNNRFKFIFFIKYFIFLFQNKKYGQALLLIKNLRKKDLWIYFFN